MGKKKKAIKIITSSAKVYNEKLLNKSFLIIGYSKKFKKHSYYEIKFDSTNFKHLTGVETDLGAKYFFKKSLNNKLSKRDFKLRDNGTTMLKLEILPEMLEVSTYRKIGVFNDGDYTKIKADISAGHQIGVLAFKRIGNNIYIPCSLIKDRFENTITCLSEQVITHIYKKDRKDKYYSHLIYMDKQYFKIPDNIQKLIN